MLKIIGQHALKGTVRVSGSKNAALPILGASMLIRGKVILKGVPKIGDVVTLLDILAGIGVKYHFEGDFLHVDSSHIDTKNLDFDKIKKIRSSIFLLSPLLYFFGKVVMPFPGGCNIGKRPIDAHLNGLEVIGYKSHFDEENIVIEGKLASGEKSMNAGFSVAATENLLIANVLRPGITKISSAAIEPHVMNLVDFLRKSGANIRIKYNHVFVIEGVEKLVNPGEFEIISDYLESGTYMILGALAAKDFIDIENACIPDLYVFIEKLKEAGVKIEDMGNDVARVYKVEHLKAVSIQTNIFPGFPTDLQSPFAVLMTQCEGNSKIHEILYEGRLNFLVELEKMKAKLAILNPHQALIFGKVALKGGTTVTSWDLRAGAAMMIAGLIASGETTVTNVEYIYRGYENFVEKLRGLGAVIEEM